MAYRRPNSYQSLAAHVKWYNKEMYENTFYSEYVSGVNERIPHEVTRSIQKHFVAYFADMIGRRGAETAEEFSERVLAEKREHLLSMEHLLSNMKLVSQFTILSSRSIDIPMDVFFCNYTIGAPFNAYTIVQGTHLHSPGRMLITLSTRYGLFWFYAMSHCVEGGTVQLIERDYDYDEPLAHKDRNSNPKKKNNKAKTVKTRRVSIRFEIPESRVGRHDHEFLSLTRIEPYICTYCKKHAPRMSMCKGCKEGLGIRVRYCTKECQRADYIEGHKRICGCSRCPEAEEARKMRREEWDGLRINT